MSLSTHIQCGLGAATAFMAVAACAVPSARAAVLSDAFPTPQAIAAHAEFLVQAPPPPTPGTVCVIDTGVTPLPDTASQIVERIAIDGGDPGDVYHTPDDPFSGHGSFVAATIASQVDGQGSAGIWPHAKIVSVRVFPRAGAGATAADYRTAIAECVGSIHHPKVITISLSATDATPAELTKLENRIADATDDRQINVVASAGNDGAGAVSFPARFSSAFAVGATDAQGAFCGFSNRGHGLDLSALGCSVMVTAFDGRIGDFNGTSFSTPMVAGVLAALRAYRPDLTALGAEQLLLATARRTTAGGTLDAEAVFRAAGLAGLVDAYQTQPSRQPVRAVPSSGVRTEVGSFKEVRDTRPARPRLQQVSFLRGRVRVKVARPPRGGTAIFHVGARTHKRSNGKLSLRSPSWRPIAVVIADRWGVRSPPLAVRQCRSCPHSPHS